MLREIQKSKGNILNHSHKHESFFKLSLDEVERDILLADEIISKNLGNVEKIISYPYGESNKNVRRLIENLGYKIAFLSTHRQYTFMKINIISKIFD